MKGAWVPASRCIGYFLIQEGRLYIEHVDLLEVPSSSQYSEASFK